MTTSSISPAGARAASPPTAPAPKRARLEPALPELGVGAAPVTAAAGPAASTAAVTAHDEMPVASSSTAPATTSAAPLSVADELALVEAEMALPVEIARTYDAELDYRSKLVLAPMVRTGTLPTRLLSLYYGAGLVWSPEIVDKAIIGARREVDPKTGVITYTKGQGAIFTTHPIEKPYLVFQIGSSNPALAVEAAKTVMQDVSGIDLNCGCPKPFSTHAGMGAALLSTPDLLLSILRALLGAIPLPVSAKIRLLPTQPATLLLAARILRTGVRNLTVHCRTRDMRSSERAMWERLGDVVQLGTRRGVPVCCNGDGEGWANWERIRAETGATSVMLARSAERNPSVFSPSGPVDTVAHVIPRLLALAAYTANAWGNTKFLLAQFKPSPPPISNMSKAERKAVSEAIARGKTEHEVAERLGVPLGDGAEVLRELAQRLAERGDVWAERRGRVEAGLAGPDLGAEEDGDGAGNVSAADAKADAAAMVDGFQVGVGQAGAVRAAEAVAAGRDGRSAHAAEPSTRQAEDDEEAMYNSAASAAPAAVTA